MPLHETLATAFAALSLAPEMVEHPPLRTVPDAHEFWDALPGLGVQPGSVTPLAVINDTQKQVRLVLDAAMFEAEAVLVHPLVNTATLIMPPADLLRFLAQCGVTPAIIDLGPAYRAETA